MGATVVHGYVLDFDGIALEHNSGDEWYRVLISPSTAMDLYDQLKKVL